MLWVAVIAILCVIVGGVAVWKLKPTPPSEPRQVTRFDYDVPEGQQFSDLAYAALAVSPDGKQFVYSTSKGLYLRSVDELTAKLIAGTEGDTQQPFFSPDGKWIGYYSGGNLKKIAISGGAPVTLCAVGRLVGASWGEDNTIVYGQLPGDIMRISANGGTPESVVKFKSRWLILPQILPDGKSILYTVATGTTQSSIVVQPLKSGESKELFAGIGARYLPTGHLVYAVGNNLLTVPFDANKLEAAGGSVPIVEGVYRTAVPQYALSDSGTLVYMPGATGEAAVGRTLVWVDREGKEEALHTPPDNYQTPKISPDGKRVALAKPGDGALQIWIWDLVRETMTKLTFDKSINLRPIWTPDGKRIVFISIQGGKYSINWKAADGTGEVEKLGSAPDVNLLPYSWSSDGKTLATEEMNSDLVRVNIGTLSIEGDHARKTLLHEANSQAHPNISPDGKYMAYFSDESGQWEVYVRPFPEVNAGKWQISTGGGESPLWSRDCRELFYRNGGAVMAVPVDTKTTFNAGKPRMLFQGTYPTGYGESPSYDISPDGKRFLMIKTSQPAASTGGPRKINIVLNWTEELKQRVPVK